MKKLSKEQRKLVQEYVNECAEVMLLADWDIRVRRKIRPGILACVVTNNDFNRADINLGSKWSKQSRAEKRVTIAHELIHVHTRSVETLIVSDLPNLISTKEHNLFWAAYTHADERFTSQLSRVLGPSLPLPPKGI